MEKTARDLWDGRRKLVRDFRKYNAVTVRKLAKLAKLSNPLISQFENGTRNLSEETWKRLASAIDRFYRGDAVRTAEYDATYRTALAENIKNWPLPRNLTMAGLLRGSQPEQTSVSIGSLLQMGRDQTAERKRQLAALEKLQSRVDDPIISELIESFRREIAEKDARIKELEAEVHSKQNAGSADD